MQGLNAYVPEWARTEVVGIAIWQMIAAFFFILAGLVAKKVCDYFFDNVILKLLARTPSKYDDLLMKAFSRPFGYFLLWLGLAAAVSVLPLAAESNVNDLVYGMLTVLIVADVIWLLFRIVDVLVAYLAQLAARTQSKLDDQLIPLIRKALKITIAVICLVTLLQLFGYNVSSLIAGLGIGGLAVALALQDTLGNFFGSVAIFLDRPFAVGDWVKIGDVEGTVEEIGFRSTRIRTWPATLVAMPNKKVSEAVIDNWSRMPKRRVTQTVGVTYETTADQMERIVASIRRIVTADRDVDQEFIVVHFNEFGESSLNILVYYFTKPIGFADHVAARERVNLAIMRAVSEQGLSIAFPTRTVYLQGKAGRDLAAGRAHDSGAEEPAK